MLRLCENHHLIERLLMCVESTVYVRATILLSPPAVADTLKVLHTTSDLTASWFNSTKQGGVSATRTNTYTTKDIEANQNNAMCMEALVFNK